MQTDSPQDNSALTQLLARGTGINLVGVMVRVLFVFLHSLFAARFYGAEAYGVYSIGVNAVILLSFVGQIGLGRTLTRFVALYRAKDEPKHIVGILKMALGISMPACIGIGLALGLGAVPAASIFGEPALVSAFRILGFAVPALTLGTLLAAFTVGFKRMRYKVIALDIVRPGVELLGLVILAWLGTRQLGLSLAYTFSVALSAALLIFCTMILLRRSARTFAEATGVSSVQLLKPVLSFAIPVLTVNILVSIANRASVMILGVMDTSVEVGVFGVLQRLVGLGTIFMFSVNVMFGPIVADLVQRQQLGELSHLYKVSTRWMLMVSLPFFLALALFGSEVLQIFGQEFTLGASALYYLVAAAIFDVATGSAGVILMMSGRPNYSAVNEVTKLVLVIGLSLLLIPQYSLLGAVWAVAAGTIVVNALRVIQVWWHLRIQPYSWSLLKLITASAVMVFALWSWKTTIIGWGNVAWFWPVLGSGVALLAYSVILVALGLEHDDIEILRSLLRKRSIRTQAPST